MDLKDLLFFILLNVVACAPMSTLERILILLVFVVLFMFNVGYTVERRSYPCNFGCSTKENQRYTITYILPYPLFIEGDLSKFYICFFFQQHLF